MLEKAKGTLIDSLQRDLQDQIDSTDAKKRIREDTIRQLIQFLGQNELQVPRFDDWAEPAIHISVLHNLAKSTQESLQSVCKLMKKSSKAIQEEEHATVALKECEKKEYIDSQQIYNRRMADTYISL